MVSCCAFCCNNRSEKKEEGVTFHRFPMDPEKKALWVQNVKRIESWTPSQYDRICSTHFEEKCFYRTAKMRRLLAGAIPTIFASSKGVQPKQPMEIPRTSEASSEDILLEPKAEPSMPSSPIEEEPPSPIEEDPSQRAKLQQQLFASKIYSSQKSKRIKLLKQSLRRYREKVSSLKQIIISLEKEKIIKENTIFLNNMTKFNTWACIN